AVWFGGNEFELLATLDKHKIDRNKDVTLIQQPFDMNLLLQKKVDAAAAMTYNEYKQVLDAGVKPDDLVVIDFNKEGTAMLEDGVFAKADGMADATNKAVAARFMSASLKGWELCKEKPAECVEIVLKESPVLGRDHQAWMMAEINKLVWGPPAPKSPLGKMDPAAFKQTAEIALKFGVIKKAAGDGAYTHESWELAQKKEARRRPRSRPRRDRRRPAHGSPGRDRRTAGGRAPCVADREARAWRRRPRAARWRRAARRSRAARRRRLRAPHRTSPAPPPPLAWPPADP